MALKDDRLASLAERGNVARFVSFGPGAVPQTRHARISPDFPARPPELDDAVRLLLDASAGTVNVRSFRSEQDKGCPFHYGIASADAAAALVRSLAADGLHTIVNETIDVSDGGVSGVSLGGVVEFAPDDTPRAVEKPGTAALPFDLAVRALRTVYGFDPDIATGRGERLEFSVHPVRAGYRRGHTIWWETEDVGETALEAAPRWPNRFSRHVGDKAYGLLIAHLLDLPVPRTTVVARRVAPFVFGTATGTGDIWLRTCPAEQTPGKFATVPYWTDPYALLHTEDPHGTALASVLAQEGVDAHWSGATIPSGDDTPDHVEGVRGTGDQFMLGEQRPDRLPPEIADDVRQLAHKANKILGPVRIEWAHDGTAAWLLQAHVATHYFAGRGVLNAGDADVWLSFSVEDGLEALRKLIPRARQEGAGIVVTGSVGITSHVGDLLRKAGVPGRLADTRKTPPARG